MKIMNVKIRGAIGFMRGLGLEEVQHDFSQYTGVVALWAQNGSGKTTLLENLSPFPQMLSKPGELYDHFYLPDSCRDVTILHNGQEVRCVLMIDAVKRKTQAFLYVDGEKRVAGAISKYKEEVQKIFGTPEFFYSLVFQGQRTERFSDLKPSQRKELLAPFFGLAHYEKLQVAAAVKVKEAELKLLLHDRETPVKYDAAAGQQTVDDLKTQLQGCVNVGTALKVQLDMKRVRLQDARDKLKQVEAQVAAAAGQRAELLDLSLAQSALLINQDDDALQLQTANQRLRQAQESLAAAQEAVKLVPVLENRVQYMLKLRHATTLCNEWQTQSKALLPQYDELYAEAASLRQRIQEGTAAPDVVARLEADVALIGTVRDQVEAMRKGAAQYDALDKKLHAHTMEFMQYEGLLRDNMQDAKLRKQELERGLAQERAERERTLALLETTLRQQDKQAGLIQVVPCSSQQELVATCPLLAEAYKAARGSADTQRQLMEMQQEPDASAQQAEIDQLDMQLVDMQQELSAKRMDHDAEAVKITTEMAPFKYDKDQLPEEEKRLARLVALHPEEKLAAIRQASEGVKAWQEMLMTCMDKRTALTAQALRLNRNLLEGLRLAGGENAQMFATKEPVPEDLMLQIMCDPLDALQMTVRGECSLVEAEAPERKLAMYQARAASIQAAEEDRRAWTERVDSLTQARAARAQEIKDRMKALEDALQGTASEADMYVMREELRGLEEDLKALDNQATLHAVKQGSLQRELEDAQRTLQDGLRHNESLLTRDATRQALEKDMGEWRVLERAFSKHGIPALELHEAGTMVTDEANYMLAQTFGSTQQIRFETLRMNQDGTQRETFDVNVHDGTDWKVIEHLSGGERVWIDTALNFALIVVQRKQAAARFATMFSDEQDGALSEGNAQLYMQLMKAAHRQTGVDLTLMITHRESLLQYADTVLTLEKGTGLCTMTWNN